MYQNKVVKEQLSNIINQLNNYLLSYPENFNLSFKDTLADDLILYFNASKTKTKNLINNSNLDYYDTNVNNHCLFFFKTLLFLAFLSKSKDKYIERIELLDYEYIEFYINLIEKFYKYKKIDNSSIIKGNFNNTSSNNNSAILPLVTQNDYESDASVNNNVYFECNNNNNLNIINKNSDISIMHRKSITNSSYLNDNNFLFDQIKQTNTLLSNFQKQLDILTKKHTKMNKSEVYPNKSLNIKNISNKLIKNSNKIKDKIHKRNKVCLNSNDAKNLISKSRNIYDNTNSLNTLKNTLSLKSNNSNIFNKKDKDIKKNIIANKQTKFVTIDKVKNKDVKLNKNLSNNLTFAQNENSFEKDCKQKDLSFITTTKEDYNLNIVKNTTSLKSLKALKNIKQLNKQMSLISNKYNKSKISNDNLITSNKLLNKNKQINNLNYNSNENILLERNNLIAFTNQINKNITHLETVIYSLKDKIKLLKNHNKKLNTNLNNQIAKNSTLMSEVEVLKFKNNKYELLENDFIKEQKEKLDYKNDLEKLKVLNLKHESDNKKLNVKIYNLKDDLENKNKLIKSNLNDIKQLKNKISSLKNFNNKNLHLTLKEENIKHDKLINKLEDEINFIKNKNIMLEKENLILNSNKNSVYESDISIKNIKSIKFKNNNKNYYNSFVNQKKTTMSLNKNNKSLFKHPSKSVFKINSSHNSEISNFSKKSIKELNLLDRSNITNNFDLNKIEIDNNRKSTLNSLSFDKMKKDNLCTLDSNQYNITPRYSIVSNNKINKSNSQKTNNSKNINNIDISIISCKSSENFVLYDNKNSNINKFKEFNKRKSQKNKTKLIINKNTRNINNYVTNNNNKFNKDKDFILNYKLSDSYSKSNINNLDINYHRTYNNSFKEVNCKYYNTNSNQKYFSFLNTTNLKNDNNCFKSINFNTFKRYNSISFLKNNRNNKIDKLYSNNKYNYWLIYGYKNLNKLNCYRDKNHINSNSTAQCTSKKLINLNTVNNEDILTSKCLKKSKYFINKNNNNSINKIINDKCKILDNIITYSNFINNDNIKNLIYKYDTYVDNYIINELIDTEEKLKDSKNTIVMLKNNIDYTKNKDDYKYNNNNNYLSKTDNYKILKYSNLIIKSNISIQFNPIKKNLKDINFYKNKLIKESSFVFSIINLNKSNKVVDKKTSSYLKKENMKIRSKNNINKTNAIANNTSDNFSTKNNLNGIYDYNKLLLKFNTTKLSLEDKIKQKENNIVSLNNQLNQQKILYNNEYNEVLSKLKDLTIKFVNLQTTFTNKFKN